MTWSFGSGLVLISTMRSYYDLSECSSIAWSRSRGTAMANTGLVSENSASTTSSGSALSGRKPGQRRSKLLITTDLLLVHPGEVLLEEFLRPMGISQYRLALAIGVPESRINAIAVPFLRPQRRLLAEDAGQP